MIQTPTAFDAMSVLHLLWKSNHIDVVAIKDFLKQEYNLTLTVLANGSIIAESEDGADKYTID